MERDDRDRWCGRGAAAAADGDDFDVDDKEWSVVVVEVSAENEVVVRGVRESDSADDRLEGVEEAQRHVLLLRLPMILPWD
jgi:hypothetical protein